MPTDQSKEKQFLIETVFQGDSRLFWVDDNSLLQIDALNLGNSHSCLPLKCASDSIGSCPRQEFASAWLYCLSAPPGPLVDTAKLDTLALSLMLGENIIIILCDT